MDNNKKKYELIKFEDGKFSFDVNVSIDENTIWLSANEIALLFERDYKTILKHIKTIFNEGELILESNSQKMRLSNNDKPTTFYSLNVIALISYRVKSKKGQLFIEWAKKIKQLKTENGSTKPLIRFEYNEISLDVSVSPGEETVWLTKNQITILFETTRQNVEYHINNIYTQNELESRATCKEILQVPLEGITKEMLLKDII